MKIQFVDLHSQYIGLKSEIDAAISEVIKGSNYIRGPFVDSFEMAYAKAIGVKYCVSCGNGTDSLYIAMRALGLMSGDEVITTAHSWISTSETITQAGGKVVFVDTHADTFTIDSNKIEEKITKRTKGIIPVHLYGQPADMDVIMDIAVRNNLWVLEDCAQSHLAKFSGRITGTIGKIGSFSFYPGKNLGAFGDAGALVTDNSDLARTMTCIARHGGLKKGEHEIEGVNSRMDGIQAAVLGVKLKHLETWTKARQRIASVYDQMLNGVGDIVTPKVAKNRDHVYHLYVIRTGHRDDLMQYLNARGVSTVINYPCALPMLNAYKYMNHKPEDFPSATYNQSRILSLPIYPEMNDVQIQYVIDQICGYFKQ